MSLSVRCVAQISCSQSARRFQGNTPLGLAVINLRGKRDREVDQMIKNLYSAFLENNRSYGLVRSAGLTLLRNSGTMLSPNARTPMLASA